MDDVTRTGVVKSGGATRAHNRMPRILVADDDADVLTAVRVLLSAEGFEVETVASPALALAAAQAQEFDAALLDLNYARDTTSGSEGLDLMQQLRAIEPRLPLVVMTAWGSVEGAVAAVRRGASDYIQKPWDNARLLQTLRTQVELGRVLRKTQRLEQENRILRRADSPDMIAASAAMRPVLELMARVAPSDANVLVSGEHGTGKELVARRLHAASHRAEQPLVTVNMGGISDNLFESELFGHVKGAFTGATTDRVGRFEMADGGTLFLDEIANLPNMQQAKLLRALQSGELERVGSSRTRMVNVRVISATNSDLPAEVRTGRFREDLLFRLNTVEIHLPPLRERGDDLLPLAMHFLTRHAKRYARAISGFDEDAVLAMAAHRWPGNVRELDHAIERAVLMARGPRIAAPDLALRSGPDAREPGPTTLGDSERATIERALREHPGNVNAAAASLGLSRSALYRRMKRHGL